MPRRFAVAHNARPYNAKAPQILAVASRGGRHLHRAARIDGSVTLTACGEFATGSYSAELEAEIIAAVGGTKREHAVTCRHCMSIAKTESDRRKAAWSATGL